MTYHSKLDSESYNSLSEDSLPKERMITADKEDNVWDVNRLANYDDPDITEIWNIIKWLCPERNTKYLHK